VSARLGVPLVVLAVAAAWALLARDLPVKGPEGPGPAFVPLLLTGVLALLGLGLLASGLKRGGLGPAGRGPGWLAAVLVIGLLAVYTAAVARVGFLLVTPVYVALAAWQCGARSPRTIGATAVGLTLAVWLLLVRLFRVPLP